MAWSKSSNTKRIKRNQIILTVILLVVLIIAGFVSWYFVFSDEVTVETTQIETAASESIPQANQEQTASDAPEFNAQSLQTVLDDWVLAQSGIASVVIADTDENILAAYNADQVYFAASIYKLYVAHEGYKQLDAGEVNPNEVYSNGNTRQECLDLMIRESDSPCAEKLWNELGKLDLTNTLRTYGMTNTSMTQITTTAQDARIMLGRISAGEDLSEDSQQALLNSMRNQIYKDALNAGFSEDVLVFNKVGFRELVEYHDVALIELEDGRRLIVSVFTENVGTAAIADLARQIETVL